MLRFYLDLDEEETAASMRISRGTVKSTTSRALAARPDPGGTAVMNLIEDQIRAGPGGRENGGAVEPPAAGTARQTPAGDGWRRRRLVPAAAAAAVVIVIAVTALTVGPGTRTRAPASAPGGAVTGPMLRALAGLLCVLRHDPAVLRRGGFHREGGPEPGGRRRARYGQRPRTGDDQAVDLRRHHRGGCRPRAMTGPSSSTSSPM